MVERVATVTVSVAMIAVSVPIAVAVVAIAIAVPVTISIAVRPSKRTRPPFRFFLSLFMPVYGVAVLLEAVHVLLGALPHTRQAEVGIAVKDEGGEK